MLAILDVAVLDLHVARDPFGAGAPAFLDGREGLLGLAAVLTGGGIERGHAKGTGGALVSLWGSCLTQAGQGCRANEQRQDEMDTCCPANHTVG